VDEAVGAHGRGTGEAQLDDLGGREHLTQSAVGLVVDGVVIGAPFSADSPRPTAVAFVQAYKAKFNAAPDGFSACAYDAVMLVRNAIAAAGPDRGAIRDWLANMKEDYDGVSGAFRLGANGDPIGKALVMTRAKGGALVLESSK